MRDGTNRWLLMLLAAMLLAACSDDTPDTSAEVAEIRFRADVGQVMEGTRATTISSNSELQSQELRIDAYFHGTTTPYFSNALLDFQSSAWGFYQSVGGIQLQLHYYWPIEGSVETASSINVGSLDFMGYCPYSLDNTCVTLNSYGNGSLSFSCTLPMTNATPGDGETTQANLKEFLYAYQPNQTKDYDDNTPKTGSNIGKVNMTFIHPFARIKFQLAANHPNITINSITFKSLKTGGTCTFDGSASSWSDLTGSSNFVMTLTGVDAVFNSNPAASPRPIGTDYIMVPQTFAGNIEVNATWTDWGEQIAHTVSTTIPSVTWAAGTSYTYTFTIRETDLIVNTEKFTEQW